MGAIRGNSGEQGQGADIALQLALGCARLGKHVRAGHAGGVAEFDLIVIGQRVGETAVGAEIIQPIQKADRIEGESVFQAQGVAELRAVFRAQRERPQHANQRIAQHHGRGSHSAPIRNTQ